MLKSINKEILGKARHMINHNVRITKMEFDKIHEIGYGIHKRHMINHNVRITKMEFDKIHEIGYGIHKRQT